MVKWNLVLCQQCRLHFKCLLWNTTRDIHK